MVFKELGDYSQLLQRQNIQVNSYYLGVDIGGTNTRVVYATENGDYYFIQKFQCTNVSTLVATLSIIFDGMKQKGFPDPTYVVIDLAGPHISTNNYKVTNYEINDSLLDVTKLPWRRDIISVLNDLESGAYGIVPFILADKVDDLFCPLSGEKKQLDKGVFAVLAAGTGLGVGLISYNKNRYEVIPSEFGHISIATVDAATELPLFEKLKPKTLESDPNRNNLNLEYEDIVSGRGIKWLYEVLKKPEEPVLQSHEVATKAIQNLGNQDCGCVKALFNHYKYLFRAAKEVGVGVFSSGVYLMGDNIVKNSAIIEKFRNELVAEYQNHYKKDWLLKMPIYTQKVEINLNLIGCIYYAVKLSQTK
ncbi:hypothetical protein DLAC_06569 [Tieghemostelium lacteum]|uniref:Glucokinase n=1 Tax=Tieghemostelium lacteum TaxID=361077 RepID=A0A151ZF90_TIELA|nr:hypothetical protein DLAC_06569 [Tieghemostelium lacteum]|eukprot:KYQ92579.1 hypothetical protein DLAC_06569 [Tieghemostelium lacteum]